MGVMWKKESVKELRKQKTRAQLQKENERLQNKVEDLEEQITNTQMALCDVYELLEGGEG